MTYSHEPEWVPYLKEIPRKEGRGIQRLVSKDAPQKIKDEIRELDNSIYSSIFRHDFIFEGEDDAG